MNTPLERILTWVLFGLLASFFGWILLLAGELSFTMARADRAAEITAQIEQRKAALADQESKITMVFVGDIMLSRAVGSTIEASGDYAYPFLRVADFLRGADLAFGNLENPISDRGSNQGSIYSFRANPRVVEGLSYAGFDVLSLANNHIWDWGALALADSISLLQAADIASVGVGGNYKEANAPAFFEVGGTNIAVLAYTNLLPENLEAGPSTPGLSDFDVEDVKNKIRSLKETGSLVVVSLHWGEEYEAQANDIQKTIARGLIDAGADLIVGHHPHVVQELEQYGDGWIAYSLGNFVFDQTFSEETMQGAALVVELEDGRVVKAVLLPVNISSDLQAEIDISLL